MEQRRVPDVSITEEKEAYLRDSVNEQLLQANGEGSGGRDTDAGVQQARERSGSVQESIHRVNTASSSAISPVTHQRIPSTFGLQQPTPIDFKQPTSYDRRASYTPLRYPPELWRPFWVRKPTLGVLLLLFLGMIIALVLLWHYSRSLNGLHFNSTTSYYAWTYAPVAFMVITVSLWRQVDFYFRLLAPWDELRNGPVSASRSLLLDYVSPINFVSFLAALKRGYTPVILSILALFILKVITVFSSALLVPLPTTLTSNFTSSATTKVFDASSLNLTAFPNIPSFNSDPVYAAMGNLAYGLSYTSGVRPNFTYIPVSPGTGIGTGLNVVTYTAQTEAMFPTLSCTPLNISIYGNTTVRSDRTTTKTTSNYIYLGLPKGTVCGNWSIPRVYTMDPHRERTPARQLEGTMQRVYCSGDEDGSYLLRPAGLLFTVTDIRYTQAVFPNGTITSSTRTLSNMSNLLCIPSYHILSATISNTSMASGIEDVAVNFSTLGNRTLKELSGPNLAILYNGIMDASLGIFGQRSDNPQASEIPSTVFNMMALATNTNGLEAFLDGQTMRLAAENTFQRVMSHYAAQSLTGPKEVTVTTTTTYEEDRLHVSMVPFYVMIAGTALLALCTIALMVVTPGPLVPKDPCLIAMSATTLARSPEVNRLLRKQLSSKSTIAQSLSEHSFSTAIATTDPGDNKFKILVSDATTPKRPPNGSTMQKWWTPNLLLLPAFVVGTVVSIGLVVVLEVLQRRSDKDQGLLTLERKSYTDIYIHSIPVLTMLLVAAVVEFLDFHVALISPWNNLASGNTSARRSVLSHLLGKLPPIALLEAFQGRHWGAIFSTSAVILASVLAVIAAGLYSVQDLTSEGVSQRLVATDAFQLQNSYNVLNDRGAAGMVRLIDYSNASYPNNTFDDLVFPAYVLNEQLESSASNTNLTTGPYAATVPALRGNLRCTIVAPTDLRVAFIPASQSYNSDHYVVESDYQLPEFCQYAGMYGNSSVGRFRNMFNVTNNNTGLYGGQLLDLVFGKNASLVANYGENRAATTGNNPAVGCPSLAFTFAQFPKNRGNSSVTAFVCYQEIQQLQANVTYTKDSTEFDPSERPTIIDSSITVVTNPNSTNSAKSFDWRIQHNIERQLYGLNHARLASTNATVSYQFDAFFSYLFGVTWNQDPATLAGVSRQDHLFTQINVLYRKYMAQAINANMRRPLTSSTSRLILHKRQSTSPQVEMQTSVIRPRLVQDNTSKIILQVFFGVIAVSNILAYILTSFHHLLPTNPCSIAGTMSLLAGSDLVWTPDDSLCDCCGKPRRSSWNHEHEAISSDETIVADGPPAQYADPYTPSYSTKYKRRQIIPDGAEWMDHIKFASVFSKRSYSLGWWKEDATKGRRRRFGVDVGHRPDGETDQEWELNERRPQTEHGLRDMVMRGRDMLGDQRGHYQRANAEPIPGMGPRASVSPMSPPTPGIRSPVVSPGPTSPRRVRFEDEM